MISNNILDQIKNIINDNEIEINKDTSEISSMKAGGKVAVFIKPSSVKDISTLIKILNDNNIQWFVVGNLTNVIFKDNGFKGIVIQLLDNMNDIVISNNEAKVQAGALLSRVANTLVSESLGGFEFASGIPGTIGGATAMNAGAYGGCMKDVVKSVTCLNGNGEIIEIEKDNFLWGYRDSIIKQKGYIVIETTLELKPGNKKEIKSKMLELNGRRKEKQPLNIPSSGSTFKRPDGYFAGKLIQDSGLMGHSIGGAQVSNKHAGFIINSNNAKVKDVEELIRFIQKTVKEKHNVALETEVIILGEDE